MSIKKIVVAAGLVLGVVGGAWAQYNIVNNPDPSLEKNAAQNIDITYTVMTEGTITVIPNPAFIVYAPDFINADTADFAGIVGTNSSNTFTANLLGLVRVGGNLGSWDVEMTAENGGLLTRGGTPAVPCATTLDEFGTPTQVDPNCVNDPGSAGSPLLFSDGDPVKLHLGVAIGNTGSAGGFQGIVGGTAYVGHNAGGVYPNPISFRNTIKDLSATAIPCIAGSQTPANADANGFGRVDTSNPACGTYGVTFAVVGGLDGSGKTIGGNPNGDYSETLSFKLIAAY